MGLNTNNLAFATDSSGNVTGLVGPGGVVFGQSLINQLIAPARQVRIATVGDSIANIATSSAGFDLRQVSATVATIAHFPVRMGAWLQGATGGCLRVVANCGVSGDTTTQLIARDANAVSAARKAIIDAAACGAEWCVMSIGINDCLSLVGGASQATIDTAVNTALANIVVACKRVNANGMRVIYQEICGINSGTAPELATRRAAILQLNAAVKAAFAATPALGKFAEVAHLVTDGAGAWSAGMSDDGIHPSLAGCQLLYQPIAEIVMVEAGQQVTRQSLPRGQNIYSNADFSVASSGLATNIALGTALGTATITRQIIEVSGVPTQEITFQPTALASGGAALSVTITVPVTGGSPYAALAIADQISGEISVYVDNGSGGAPALYSMGCELYKVGAAVTMHAYAMIYDNTATTGSTPTAPVDVHFATPPMVLDEASAALTTVALILRFYTAQIVNPLRVRLSGINVVKLPSGYAA